MAALKLIRISNVTILVVSFPFLQNILMDGGFLIYTTSGLHTAVENACSLSLQLHAHLAVSCDKQQFDYTKEMKPDDLEEQSRSGHSLSFKNNPACYAVSEYRSR